jgi:hypothetical protein
MCGRAGVRRVRGQAEVVGALILVGVSVLFTTIVLFWSQSVTGQAGSAMSTNIYLSNMRASEQFSIDEVLFGGEELKVYVRNFGDVPVRITAVYVYDTETGALLNTGTELPSPKVVLPRSQSSISVSFKSSPYLNRMVSIRLASDRGNVYERVFTVG